MDPEVRKEWFKKGETGPNLTDPESGFCRRVPNQHQKVPPTT